MRMQRSINTGVVLRSGVIVLTTLCPRCKTHAVCCAGLAPLMSAAGASSGSRLGSLSDGAPQGVIPNREFPAPESLRRPLPPPPHAPRSSHRPHSTVKQCCPQIQQKSYQCYNAINSNVKFWHTEIQIRIVSQFTR